jgi:hypothetical protein
MITAYNAWSTRRCRANSDGKTDPARSFESAAPNPGRGRQHPWTVTIPLPDPPVSAFVRFGADHRGQLGLDQRLVDRRRGLPDPVGHIGLLDRVQDFNPAHASSRRSSSPGSRR